MKKILLTLSFLFLLNGCSHDIESYKDQKPTVDIKEFFDGKIKGWGIIQDHTGEVVSRFDVVIDASWEGNQGILDEDFTYYNGTTDKRIWKLTKNADGTYTGRADDILDEATGTQQGNAINFVYSMDLDVDGSTFRVKFDDWMWQMNDGVLINRSYIKKFGITVAELTLFMQKQN